MKLIPLLIFLIQFGTSSAQTADNPLDHNKLLLTEVITLNTFTVVETYSYNGKLFSGYAQLEGPYGAAIVQYIDGYKEGKMTTIATTGVKKGYLIYKKGVVVENEAFFDDGIQKWHFFFTKEGYKKGSHHFNWADGRMMHKTKYSKKGRKKKWEEYYTNGQVAEKGKSKKDDLSSSDDFIKVGKWRRWNKSGELLSVITYHKKAELKTVKTFGGL